MEGTKEKKKQGTRVQNTKEMAHKQDTLFYNSSLKLLN
jgi:hypothetical protein